MNVFITGASGLIGKRLTEILVSKGHEVIAYDIFHPNNDYIKSLKIVTGDIIKGENLEYIESSDIVIHLAAAGVTASARNWNSCTNVNIIGTQSLLYALTRLSKSPAFFFPRTFYQDHFNETPCLWQNPYVASKEIACRLVNSWFEQVNREARVVFGTLFHVYGPGGDPNSLINYAARQLKSGQPAKFGSGRAIRDWIYVDDLVSAILACLQEILKKNSPISLHYDFGTGVGYTVREVVEQLAQLSRKKIHLDFDSVRDRNDSHISGVASKIFPNWTPQYSLQEGLRRVINSI